MANQTPPTRRERGYAPEVAAGVVLLALAAVLGRQFVSERAALKAASRPVPVAAAPLPVFVPTPVPVAPPEVLPAARPVPEPVVAVAVPEPEPAGSKRLAFRPLAARLDTRDEETLLRELERFEEVRLDTTAMPRAGAGLVQLAASLHAANLPYAGPPVLAKARPDLVGLDYRLGSASQLSRDQALALKANSQRMRRVVAGCVVAQSGDPRPDPARLEAAFLDEDAKWGADALPCFQQMLQPETRGVRRVAVEAVARMSDPAASEMLARWAAFDTSAELRGGAVEALKGRPAGEYLPALLEALRHPWPRAAEHAAEALVALGCREALADLVALSGRADPDAPYRSADGRREYVREVVRVNHLANCVLCHAPSTGDSAELRAAVPDRSKALPDPSSSPTPAYYTTGELFVQANQTYLRQDFSAEQPVAAPGKWPRYQRFDYLVRRRPARPGDALTAEDSPFKRALAFAVERLGGGVSPAAFRSATPRPTRADAADARHDAAFLRPDAALKLASADFGERFMDLPSNEQVAVEAKLARSLGNAGAKAVILAAVRERAADPDAVRAETARRLVERLETPEAEAGAAFARPGDRDAAVGAAVALLRDDDAGRRADGCRRLMALGDAAAGAAFDLGRAMRDADAGVRLAAVQAVRAVPKCVAYTEPALAALLGDPDAAVALAAARALAEHSAAAPPLVRAAEDALARNAPARTRDQAAAVHAQAKRWLATGGADGTRLLRGLR